MDVLELADIDSIQFGGHDGLVTEVRGYQNYNISNSWVDPIGNPTKKRPWADTQIKSNDFDRFMEKIQPDTYADFGSNLGYYVFRAAFEHGAHATGIDYSAEYINVCNLLVARHCLQSDCTFMHSNLQQLNSVDKYYDFMTVFNVIHHLYNRTEKYMDMDRLLQDFANKADSILFEVPTEKDQKGHKWTMDTGYKEALFVESAQKIFSSVKHYPGQTEHRPYYLCIK